MKVIGIYNGRFQPPHKGHLTVYKQLKNIVGSDTFVVSSDKVEPPNSPLSFSDKELIWVKHGVPSSHIVKVKNGYTPTEVIQRHPGAAAVFALGEKDKARLVASVGNENGKEVWLTSKGAKSYFQPYEPNKNNMETGDKRGYVIIFNDVKIDGKDVSGTDVRNALGAKTQTDENKRKFFLWAFGWFDASLYKLLVDKFSAHDVNFKPSPPSPEKNMKEYIENLVKECIMELMAEPPPSSTPSGIESGMAEPDYSQEQRAKDAARAKIDAEKQKKANERDLATRKKELDYKKKDIERLRRDTIPDLEKQRQDLNKQISGQI